MSIKRRQLEQCLTEMSHAPSTPGADFVDRLGTRLRNLPERQLVTVPASRKLVIPRVSWIVGILIALAAGLTGAQQIALTAQRLWPGPDASKHSVVVSTTTTSQKQRSEHSGVNGLNQSGDGGSTSTTSEEATPSTSDGSGAPASVSTSTTAHTSGATASTAPGGSTGETHLTTTTTTTVPARSETPTTTTTSTTTTTIPSGGISMSCTSSTPSGVATVTCNWSASASASFDHYNLIRWVGMSDPSTVIYTSGDKGRTSYADASVTDGVAYSYMLVAYAANGSSVGYSSRPLVSCCTR